jgi:putative spermidine/putrescine transport system substrate-binding protein
VKFSFKKFFKLRAVALMAVFVFGPGTLVDSQTLRIASWGGAYAKSQILGFIRDYEEATGVEVELIDYSGGIDELRSQVRSYNVRWDIIDLELFDAIRAHREGLLESLDLQLLKPAPDGTLAVDDFVEGSLMDFGVGNILFSTVIAYSSDYGYAAPERLEDFFNLAEFPGDRSLRRTPVGNLEWALLADGVEPDAVYHMLETDSGVQRALRKLESIKAVTRWWTDGEQAIAWLEHGDVRMGSVYNGRVHDAVQRGANVRINWDRQLKSFNVWGIAKNGRNVERAMEFIQFVAVLTRDNTRKMNVHAEHGVQQHGLMRTGVYVAECLSASHAATD